MALPAWVNDAYVTCGECTCCVYYGIDAETACLAPDGDPEVAVIGCA